MRKLILRWLIGCDDEDWHDMFKIAVSSHEQCKKMLQTETFLIERYKAISNEQNAFLDALKDAENIPALMLEIIDVLRKSRMQTGGAE